MIRIKRLAEIPNQSVYAKSVPCKREEGKLSTAYENEQYCAIKYHEDPQNFKNERKLCKGSFDYTVYRNKALRDAISERFNDKCAYCESKGSEVSGKDVEHFRPKGKVTADKKTLRPGYYWLGGDWGNLLLACQHCNRLNTHEFWVTELNSEIRSGGKGSKFPLSDERLRARSPNHDIDLEDTVRLLINPCIDDPELELTYTEEGDILAATDNDGNFSLKGYISIETYSLDRLHLRLAREKELQFLEMRLTLLQHSLCEERTVLSEKHIEKLIDAILKMFRDDAIYLGIKRYWLRQKIANHTFDDLKQWGINLEDLVR